MEIKVKQFPRSVAERFSFYYIQESSYCTKCIVIVVDYCLCY